MGIAAYNRGSRVISAQLDREAEERKRERGKAMMDMEHKHQIANVAAEHLNRGEAVLLTGPPGTGKITIASLAAAMVTDLADPVEVAMIWIGSGYPAPSYELGRRFRAPHHTCSEAGLFGSVRPAYAGIVKRGHVIDPPKPARAVPGEVSLAHGGTLLLDEAPEFRGTVLAGVAHARLRGAVHLRSTVLPLALPARFALIATALPCPCGYHGGTSGPVCQCSDGAITRYRERLAPLRPMFEIAVSL